MSLTKAVIGGQSRVINTAWPTAAPGVAVFGDSFVEARTWPADVGTALGVSAVNAGRGGWASSDVALRQGGLAVGCTLAGDTIPASGAVAATVTPITSFRSDSTGITYTWGGTLAGIPGTLTHTVAGSDGGWTFTRTASGAATTCLPGTPFRCTEFDAYTAHIQVLWVGRNNINLGNVSLSTVERDIAAMASRLTTAAKRVLVLGVTNAGTEASGSANYIAITSLNTALAATYGSRFFDVRRYLIDSALSDAGITPTSQDTTDIGNDVIPTSLRADNLHPTTAAFALVGTQVAAKIRALGWA